LWIDVDESGDQWRASLNRVMNLSQDLLNFFEQLLISEAGLCAMQLIQVESLTSN